ncbi:unnamed protein product [Rotaria socialis]|uniref:Saposin B-type domain-containing protein n=2 Tax=Rotaria socialis TaxID=392032 RepID=A0A820TNP4_9BILA|nr:unnamed protein product [Rotaria socialis]CAF3362744.1 unnamed protein product [Rotaria socialis]CAF3515003.1 unnamed protein product [Rotaria socialis]CAF3542863.1 unnamed protein product [Rotaria socialis]CAF3673460.1 unnamed protein product [Rotaria socialis]
MLKAAIGCISLLLIISLPSIECRFMDGINSVNGGTNCATCTILLGIVDHLAIVYNESAAQALEHLCSFLPDDYKIYCKTAVDFLGPIIIDGFIKGDNPDVICHGLTLCSDDPGQAKCRIYPSKSTAADAENALKLRERHPDLSLHLSKIKICQIPGIAEICKILNNAFNNHIPAVDLDNDKFGTEPTLRGSSWRGKDCNDFSSQVYPGAQSVDGDSVIDHNCNGIYGLDSTTGQPWETEFCNDTQRLGIAVLGDSISAHFHLPEQWLDAKQLSTAVFQHLTFILENELDWPQLSASTGHLNVSWPNIQGQTRSLYARLFDLDHCNHRDYQNIAVNGARSGSMTDIMKALARHPKNDVPLLVIYSLVGNDVCNGHPDTIDHMTTVAEMTQNVLTTLQYLDTVLPKGSHVLTTGLANGSFLYALLHDRIHPFGRVGPPVSYPQIYDYLSCLQISPCNGWMTSNGTLRDLTTQRAVELSAAIKNVSFTYQPAQYDIDYLDFPFDEVIQEWIAQGGEPWQLIESVDGFHINQYGHALVSDVLWSWLQKNRPQWIPPMNPHNADIERVFKDQGGYD